MDLDEEEGTGHQQRGAQRIKRGPPLLCPVDNSGDKTDGEEQKAQQVQRIPLVFQVPVEVPCRLAPLPVHPTLKQRWVQQQRVTGQGALIGHNAINLGMGCVGAPLLCSKPETEYSLNNN